MLPKVAAFQAAFLVCAVSYPDNSFARREPQSSIHRRGIRLTPGHIPPDAGLFHNDLSPLRPTHSDFDSIYYNVDPISATHGLSTPIPGRGFKPIATSSVYMGPEPLSFDPIDLDFDPFYSPPVHLASGHIRPDSRLPIRPTHSPIRPTLGPIHSLKRPIHLTKGPIHPTQGPIPQTKEPLHPTPEPILPLPKPIRHPPGPVHPTSGPFHPSLGSIPSTSYPSHPSPESSLLKPRPIHRKPRPIGRQLFRPNLFHSTPIPIHLSPGPLHPSLGPIHPSLGPIQLSPKPIYHSPGPIHPIPGPIHRPKAPIHDLGYDYDEGPVAYDFRYDVKDDYTGANFGHQEASDGYKTEGFYYVPLPDGRLQKVSYHVNGDSGFVAEISYEGVAHYPAHAPSLPYKPPHAPSLPYKPPHALSLPYNPQPLHAALDFHSSLLYRPTPGYI